MWPRAGKAGPHTWASACPQQPSDLLRRDFSVHAPHERWGLDFTYVRWWVRLCSTAFVMDTHSPMVSDEPSPCRSIRASRQVLSSRPPDRQACEWGAASRGFVQHSDHGPAVRADSAHRAAHTRRRSKPPQARPTRPGVTRPPKRSTRRTSHRAIWPNAQPGPNEVEKAMGRVGRLVHHHRPHRHPLTT